MTILRAAATANFTLDNTGTAALITGLTLTPASGDYFLYATVEFQTPAGSPAFPETDIFSVWVNNVEIDHSVRTYINNDSIDSASIVYVLTCKVSPTGSQDVEIRHVRSTATAPAIATNREMTLFPIGAGTDYELTSTSEDSTASGTMSDIVGMSQVPVAGTYLAIISTSWKGDSGGIAEIQVAVDGVAEAHSFRDFFWESSGADQEYCVMTLAKVTMDGIDAVSMQFASQSGTVVVHHRTMNLIPIATADIFQAIGTVDDTDSTTTDKLLDDMTIPDPGAGDMLVMFSITQAFGALATDEGRVTYSIHEGGAVVTDSERNNEIEDSLDSTYHLAFCGGRVTVGGSTDDLEIFWQGASTQTRTGRNRTLIAIRELGIAWEQEGHRWREDDDDEANAAWRQAQDVDDTVDKEVNIRSRVLMSATGDPPTLTRTYQYKRDDEPDSEFRTI